MYAPKNLTIPEAASAARIAAFTLRRHIAAGRGPVVLRVGSKMLVREADLEAWLGSNPILPTPAAPDAAPAKQEEDATC